MMRRPRRRLPLTLAATAILMSSCLLLVPVSNSEDNAVFRGHDPLWDAPIAIVARGGTYFLNDAFMKDTEMEELRHANMPTTGLSLALKERSGKPSMYWLVLPERVDLYTSCEIGPCELKRSIKGTCCSDP